MSQDMAVIPGKLSAVIESISSLNRSIIALNTSLESLNLSTTPSVSSVQNPNSDAGGVVASIEKVFDTIKSTIKNLLGENLGSIVIEAFKKIIASLLGVTALTKGVTDAIDKSWTSLGKKAIDNFSTIGGSTDKAGSGASKDAGNANEAIKKFVSNARSSISSLFTSIGSKMAGIGKHFRALAKTSPFPIIVVGIIIAITAIALLIVYWDKLSPSIQNVIKWVGILLGVIGAGIAIFAILNAVIAMNPFIFVAMAIIAIIILIIANLENLKNFWDGIISGIQNGVSVFFGWIDKLPKKQKMEVAVEKTETTTQQCKKLANSSPKLQQNNQALKELNVLAAISPNDDLVNMDKIIANTSPTPLPMASEAIALPSFKKQQKQSYMQASACCNKGNTTINIQNVEIADGVIENLEDFIVALQKRSKERVAIWS